MRILLLLCILTYASCSKDIHIAPELSGNGVTVRIAATHVSSGTLYLYRSTSDFSRMESLDLNGYPIVKWKMSAAKEVVVEDSIVPQGVSIYYYCRIVDLQGKVHYSQVASVITPPVVLPQTSRPVKIIVDKQHYTLSVVADGITLKRYAVNLGSKPKNRKLHFDNASTPEGHYKMRWFNNKSVFHRSMAVSYPNDVDRKRYASALKAGEIPSNNGKPAGIGGSITIHGGGVWNNWTWGCVALEDYDVDELMDSGLIKVGTPIIIGGGEIPLSDLL